MKTIEKSLKCAGVLMLACAMTIGLGVCLSGCGASNEEDTVRGVLTQELDALKNMDDEMVEKILAEGTSGAEVFAEVGIEAETFVRNVFGGVDYTIDSVSVDGDKATATVTLAHKDLGAAVTAFWEGLVSNEQLISESKNMSEEDAMKKIGALLMEAIQNAKKVSDTVDVALEKGGETWEISADGTQSVMSIFTYGLAEAFQS